MKIALIDPSLFTWPYDSALADGLAANGHEVALFTKHLAKGEQGKGASLTREVFYPGFQSRLMQKLPGPLWLGLKGLAHPLSLLRLYFILRNWRPDIIHFQWAPLPVVDRFFIPLFRTLAPVVLTVHDSSPFNNNPSAKLQRLGAYSIMHKFDRLIVHTEKAQTKLAATGLDIKHIARIAHGVLGASGPQPTTAPASLNDERPVNILLFGKLKPYKGADILIQALARLPAAIRSRTRLRIVGKAEMETQPLFDLARKLEVDSLIQWDLRFVDDSEMAGIFDSADIMAMPYRDIDASGVMMVALSIGRPIIASRIGLFAEILEDGTHGYLVPQEDPEALAAAIEKLVTNGQMRLGMGENVRALGRAIPDWASIGQTTASLYAQMLRR